VFLLGQWEKELLLSARVTDSELLVQHTALMYLNFFIYTKTGFCVRKWKKKRVGGLCLHAEIQLSNNAHS